MLQVSQQGLQYLPQQQQMITKRKHSLIFLQTHGKRLADRLGLLEKQSGCAMGVPKNSISGIERKLNLCSNKPREQRTHCSKDLQSCSVVQRFWVHKRWKTIDQGHDPGGAGAEGLWDLSFISESFG
jgi:hypothetical protein